MKREGDRNERVRGRKGGVREEEGWRERRNRREDRNNARGKD
jgi:hypothetical protein